MYDRYKDHVRHKFSSIDQMRGQAKEFAREYPVVLSTTFSARTCLFGEMEYDYIIMDEASQVSVETGLLALTCARNAVIVGDRLQLPNIVTDDDKLRLNAIAELYDLPTGYDSAHHSFLDSVCSIIEDIPQTLLREHYRCHPRIINYCNQKFYGGNLLIMTKDRGEENVLCAIKTVKGNHAINKANQREVDVVAQEILPTLDSLSDVGIITPYNNQIELFSKQLPDIEVATIHKYQGREKDVIVMSVVDNQITDFTDNANLINVAVSRAKQKLYIVATGNEQSRLGNITDLLGYIAYNNCTVTESKVASIFDYLYEQYTTQRLALLKRMPSISKYASENLAYALLTQIIENSPSFSTLKVLCHIPIRLMIRDVSALSPQEQKYISHYATHVDFLFVSRVTKKPILAIETDGYTYHREGTEQYTRDRMKDNILATYAIPLVRLSTKGSGEEEKVRNALLSALNIV